MTRVSTNRVDLEHGHIRSGEIALVLECACGLMTTVPVVLERTSTNAVRLVGRIDDVPGWLANNTDARWWCPACAASPESSP